MAQESHAVATVNISLQGDLLRAIDLTAREEARSRSELIREAARSYIERKRRWQTIFRFGERQARARGLSESEVGRAIARYRRAWRKA